MKYAPDDLENRARFGTRFRTFSSILTSRCHWTGTFPRLHRFNLGRLTVQLFEDFLCYLRVFLGRLWRTGRNAEKAGCANKTRGWLASNARQCTGGKAGQRQLRVQRVWISRPEITLARSGILDANLWKDVKRWKSEAINRSQRTHNEAIKCRILTAFT